MAHFAPWLGVFETLRVIDGVPLFPEEHLAELERAAQALGMESRLDPRASSGELTDRSGRWRWIVDEAGARTMFTAEPPADEGLIALAVSPLRLGSQNWDARFKTFSYLTHAQALRQADTPE